jgi:3-hydroxyisobutyrate dehydrogenase-like beta-hydroxyacid dehydrogenase
MTPLTPHQALRHDARFRQGYVAAPVFGNPDAAKARQLFIIAAGAPADLDRCQPIFAVLGQRVFRVGSDPATANLVKLAGNAMSAATLEVLGESPRSGAQARFRRAATACGSDRNDVRQPRSQNLW